MQKRLDAELLVDRLPVLLDLVKNPKDIQSLLRTYQIWAQGTYPRLSFRDFCIKTEQLCRKRRLRMYMQQLVGRDKRQRMGVSEYGTGYDDTTGYYSDALDPIDHSDDDQTVRKQNSLDFDDDELVIVVTRRSISVIGQNQGRRRNPRQWKQRNYQNNQNYQNYQSRNLLSNNSYNSFPNARTTPSPGTRCCFPGQIPCFPAFP
jgi:hypothetical protein